MTQNKNNGLNKNESLTVSYTTKRTSFLLSALLVALSLVNSPAYAQKTEQKEQGALPFRNSISLSSFLLLGSLQVNYERLAGKRHGLLAEGYYAFGGTSANSWTLGASYRYHFKPSLKGLFVNAFYRHGGNFTNTIKIKENNATTTYKLKTQLNVLGMGIGNRWQWNNGLAVVVRGGYGYQINPDYSWSPNVPTDNDTKSRQEAQLGLDLELSVGYSF